MRNILFPILNGNIKNIQYSIGKELGVISKDEIQPRYLWITKMFQTKKDSRVNSEEQLNDILNRYPPPVSYVDACYRSLRCEGIELSDVVRVNMVETPYVPLEKMFKQSIIYLYACKKYLLDNSIDGIVFLMGRGLFQRSLGLMARKLGIQTIYLCDAFIPGETTHIWDSESHASNDLKGITLYPLNSKEQNELNVFIEKQKSIANISLSPYDASVFIKKIRSFFVILHGFFLHDRIFGNKGAFGSAKDDIMRRLRPWFIRRYYTTTSSGKLGKYVYLPYQVYYDLLLPLMWTEYTNIEYLTDVCSSALPEGYTLVVKEHPHFKGGTPVGELRRISRQKNVMIAPIDVSSHELIEHSSAVIILCSNVGWQSLMYHKPVVVLNSSSDKDYRFYLDDYGVTFNASTPDVLPSVIRDALDSKPNEDRIDSFLYHVIMRHREINDLCPVDYNKINKEENYHIVADYIFREMMEHG